MQIISGFSSALCHVNRLALALLFLSLSPVACLNANAQIHGPLAVDTSDANSAKSFDEAANAALVGMRQRVGELGISGVAAFNRGIRR
jgi:hypothetical protein